MNKKSSLKAVKKAGVKGGKAVSLSTRNARITQNLGNGFERFVFQPFTVLPGRFLTITLSSGTLRSVISAGWSISGLLPAYATDSFPRLTNQWIIVIHNPTVFTRTVIPYLITKFT